jgi:hypothetical protein
VTRSSGGLATLAAVTLSLAAMPATAGQRAPARPWLQRSQAVRLFNGKDLTGWKLRHSGGKNAWTAANGVLSNAEPSTDLVSDRQFGDCNLHVEFNVPKGGNSGVYLQGRYEVQVADSYGQAPGTGTCGAIYSKIVPLRDAGKPAGAWQTYDVRFIQARLGADGKVTQHAVITVLQNGVKIVDAKEIDGVTGGALDDKEGTPGPILLQGDHTAVQYRNITITPVAPPARPAAPVR